MQWCTFVEIIGGDESLQHQLKRQDCVNFWVAPPPWPPPLFFFARYLDLPHVLLYRQKQFVLRGRKKIPKYPRF